MTDLKLIEWNRLLQSNPDFKMKHVPFSAREIFNFTCAKSLQDTCDKVDRRIDDETALQSCNVQLEALLGSMGLRDTSAWNIPRLFVKDGFLDRAGMVGKILSKNFCHEVTPEEFVKDFEDGKLMRVADSCNPFNLEGVAYCVADPNYVAPSEEGMSDVANYAVAGSGALILSVLAFLVGPEIIPLAKKLWDFSRVVDLTYFVGTRVGD